MLRRIGILLWILSTLAPLHADEKAPEKAPPSLREYASREVGRQAYGLYFQGRKAGWMIVEFKLETRGEGAAKKQIAVSSTQTEMAMGRAGSSMSLHSDQAAYYELEGGGRLLFATQDVLDDGKTTKFVARPQDKETEKAKTVNGKVDAEKLWLWTQRGGRVIARRALSTQDSLGRAQEFEAWLESKPKAGATFSMNVLDLQQGRDTPSTYIYQSARAISWGGVPTQVFSLRSTSQGLASRMDVKPNGWPLKMQIAGGFELRAEDEALAKKLSGKPIDLLAASMIPTNQNLGDPHEVKTLKLEISGVKDFSFPASPRQQVLAAQGSKVVLQLRRDFHATTAAPLSSAQRAEYLRAADTYSQTAAIKNLARKIVGDEHDVSKQAVLLKSWVFLHLRKSMSANATTASEVLAQRAGDCTEHTILFVAFARALGIPAREAGGVMFAGGADKPFFAWHAWPQYHDGRGWISIDPTWDENFVDASHIQFSTGEDDWAWMNVLGNIQIKVLAMTKDKP